MIAIAKYRFNDKELKELLSTLVILVDTREQVNNHVLNYFEHRKINHKIRKLDYGDYGAYIPSNNDYGIVRDIYFNVFIERKNSIDELASTIKDRTRFENELIRSQNSNFLLLVEDHQGYENLIHGNYRSRYDPKALLASLKAFEARYNFNTVFIAPLLTGNFIYHHLYYNIREFLKG